MQPFIHDDFLLGTDLGRRLFHETASSAPIYDFHCHLDAKKLAEDSTYPNLTSLWIRNDPYKHRAMRLAGVPERCITGEASDEEKFACWSETLPRTLGNPLFEWSALELARCFGISELLNPSTRKSIGNACDAALRKPALSARGMLESTALRVLCTSDNLLDDLASHAHIARTWSRVRVLPSLRADDLLMVEASSHGEWLLRLGAAAGFAINTLEDWKQAVFGRMDHFSALGCRLVDHGIDEFAYTHVPEDQAARLFEAARCGSLPKQGNHCLASGLLRILVQEYSRRGWALQLHLGAQRRTSTRLRERVGISGGFATIGNRVDIHQLCTFFDDLEKADALPRTIIYPLHPGDYASVATLTGSFPGDGVRGKIQLGPAWWYNDHALGMRSQLDTLSSYGMLSTFVGMTTDSRSPLSIHRHEYFRRVLCDWMGRKVLAGEFPTDELLLSGYVRDICGGNVCSWLGLEKES